MEVVHLAVVFCVRVITGAPSVTARLVFVSTAKWVLMATTVSCVPTTYRDPSADGVNLVTGDSQRVVVKVQTQINISKPRLLTALEPVSRKALQLFVPENNHSNQNLQYKSAGHSLTNSPFVLLTDSFIISFAKYRMFDLECKPITTTFRTCYSYWDFREPGSL